MSAAGTMCFMVGLGDDASQTVGVTCVANACAPTFGLHVAAREQCLGVAIYVDAPTSGLACGASTQWYGVGAAADTTACGLTVYDGGQGSSFGAQNLNVPRRHCLLCPTWKLVMWRPFCNKPYCLICGINY